MHKNYSRYSYHSIEHSDRDRSPKRRAYDDDYDRNKFSKTRNYSRVEKRISDDGDTKRSVIDCRHWLRGDCAMGTECGFLHDARKFKTIAVTCFHCAQIGHMQNDCPETKGYEYRSEITLKFPLMISSRAELRTLFDTLIAAKLK